METQQARDILAAHDARDTALRNLRNAAAMAADDSRSTEMLESAGDQYATAVRKFYEIEVLSGDLAVEAMNEEETIPFEPGDTAKIVEAEGIGQGVVEGFDDARNVNLRLDTDAVFRGEEFKIGAIIAVPVDCLDTVGPIGE